MKAFRIGRKPPGIWTNTTPPIRGGVYKKQQGADIVGDVSDSEESLLSDNIASLSDNSILASLTSNESDVDTLSKKDNATPVPKTFWRDSNDPLNTERVFAGSPAAFTDWAENQDVDRDLRDYPSVNPAVQQEIARKYKMLHQRVHDEGFYDCSYLEYGKEMARYTSLFTASMVALRCEWYMSSAFFLGLFWHQIMFTAHDAGHRAITGIFEVDTLIGMFVGDFCCGLSIGWWKSSHNVHHLVTNYPVSPTNHFGGTELTENRNTTLTYKISPCSRQLRPSSGASTPLTTAISPLLGTSWLTSWFLTRSTLTTPSWALLASTCTYSLGCTSSRSSLPPLATARPGGSALLRSPSCLATGTYSGTCFFGGHCPLGRPV